MGDTNHQKWVIHYCYTAIPTLYRDGPFLSTESNKYVLSICQTSACAMSKQIKHNKDNMGCVQTKAIFNQESQEHARSILWVLLISGQLGSSPHIILLKPPPISNHYTHYTIKPSPSIHSIARLLKFSSDIWVFF